MERGYIRIFRKFFDGPLWKKKRVFSKAEAWIDLIQMARWKDTPEKFFDERGQYILERGDLWASLRFLGTRWKWSPEKVNRFCSLLVENKSISFKKRDTQRTIIHINKLGTYLEWGNTKRDAGETQARRRRDAGETKKKPVKKVKKDKSTSDSLSDKEKKIKAKEAREKLRKMIPGIGTLKKKGK